MRAKDQYPRTLAGAPLEDVWIDLRAVLEYLEQDEREDYESWPRADHIYLPVRRLRLWLDAQRQACGYDLKAWDHWNKEAREVLGLYGVDAALFTHDQLVEALEREGQCGAGEVIQAVKYGANYPVRRPAPLPS
jgi:hypothetical protein